MIENYLHSLIVLVITLSYSLNFVQLTKKYIANARAVCQQRVASGGYRLAWMLEDIFGCDDAPVQIF